MSRPATHSRSRGAFASLGLDLFMVGLAIINLAWLIFDAIWLVPELRQLLGLVIPQTWLQGYAVVNDHFFRIDMVFVSIFLTEFLLRWGNALWQRRYPYWFAFPVLHWYDILGCIPVAGLRWLRILRIFAILHRLQRMGFIDYRSWSIYRLLMRLYDIVMEEISDRVVIRVLTGVQQEINASHDIEKRVVDEVLRPRQQLITDALRDRVVRLGSAGYRRSRRDLHDFVTRTVSIAVRENREIRNLDRIPLLGGVLGDRLDNAITDIICRVIDELAGQLGSGEFEQLFEDLSSALFDALGSGIEHPGTRDELSNAINDILELVKQQVSRKRWLQAEAGQSLP